MKTICIILLMLIIFYGIWKLFNEVIFPKIVFHNMTEIERNPKWITSQLTEYGFDDIDFILCESKYAMLPHFRLSDSRPYKFELWISTDTTTKEVEELGRAALIGKITAKYGLFYSDKPLYWLSALCYMLDGGDIKVKDATWEENDE